MARHEGRLSKKVFTPWCEKLPFHALTNSRPHLNRRPLFFDAALSIAGTGSEPIASFHRITSQNSVALA
jgi:hypothetical protein